ncbi:unnamed protein product [Pedinophyceae sp. YPF-701]|nr:unnamed protein product [Pedinophyceae sp. YPF-701]
MGVKGLMKWIFTAHPECVVDVRDAQFDHVYFDMPNVLHEVVRQSKSERDFVIILYQQLDAVLNMTNPRKTVMLALDGPAPLAKLLVQRTRRLKEYRSTPSDSADSDGDADSGSESESSELIESGIDDDESDDDGGAAGERKPSRAELLAGAPRSGVPPEDWEDNPWLSIALTPGTPFMLWVDHLLEYFVCQRLLSYRWRTRRFEISGSRTAGEGELKVFHRVKHPLEPARSAGRQRRPDTHLVCGNDTDLILLGSLSGVPNVYLQCSQLSAFFNLDTFRAPKLLDVDPAAYGLRDSDARVLDGIASKGRRLTKLRRDWSKFAVSIDRFSASLWREHGLKPAAAASSRPGKLPGVDELWMSVAGLRGRDAEDFATVKRDVALVHIMSGGDDYLPAVRGLRAASWLLYDTRVPGMLSVYSELRSAPGPFQGHGMTWLDEERNVHFNLPFLREVVTRAGGKIIYAAALERDSGFLSTTKPLPDILHYLQGLRWNLEMFLACDVPNYAYHYDSHPPAAQQLALVLDLLLLADPQLERPPYAKDGPVPASDTARIPRRSATSRVTTATATEEQHAAAQELLGLFNAVWSSSWPPPENGGPRRDGCNLSKRGPATDNFSLPEPSSRPEMFNDTGGFRPWGQAGSGLMTSRWRLPLRPDECCMALLPRTAQDFAPALLRPLMDAGSPIEDMYSECQTCLQLMEKLASINRFSSTIALLAAGMNTRLDGAAAGAFLAASEPGQLAPLLLEEAKAELRSGGAARTTGKRRQVSRGRGRGGPAAGLWARVPGARIGTIRNVEGSKNAGAEKAGWRRWLGNQRMLDVPPPAYVAPGRVVGLTEGERRRAAARGETGLPAGRDEVESLLRGSAHSQAFFIDRAGQSAHGRGRRRLMQEFLNPERLAGWMSGESRPAQMERFARGLALSPPVQAVLESSAAFCELEEQSATLEWCLEFVDTLSRARDLAAEQPGSGTARRVSGRETPVLDCLADFVEGWEWRMLSGELKRDAVNTLASKLDARPVAGTAAHSVLLSLAWLLPLASAGSRPAQTRAARIVAEHYEEDHPYQPYPLDRLRGAVREAVAAQNASPEGMPEMHVSLMRHEPPHVYEFGRREARGAGQRGLLGYDLPDPPNERFQQLPPGRSRAQTVTRSVAVPMPSHNLGCTPRHMLPDFVQQPGGRSTDDGSGARKHGGRSPSARPASSRRGGRRGRAGQQRAGEARAQGREDSVVRRSESPRRSKSADRGKKGFGSKSIAAVRKEKDGGSARAESPSKASQQRRGSVGRVKGSNAESAHEQANGKGSGQQARSTGMRRPDGRPGRLSGRRDAVPVDCVFRDGGVRWIGPQGKLVRSPPLRPRALMPRAGPRISSALCRVWL